MKKILLCVVFLMTLMASAQSPTELIDSLKRELRKNPDKLRKATLYSDLTFYYSSLSIDSALVYGNRALAFAKTLNDPKVLSQVYSDIGSVYMAKGDLPKSKQHYFASLAIRTKSKDREGMASNWSNIGGVYQRMAVLDTAMTYYLKSLRYFESVNNERNVDFLKNNIGVLYEDMRNFRKAVEMYKEVAAYRKQTGQDIQLAMVYNNLANVSKKTNDLKQSEAYFKSSIALSQKQGDSLLLANTYNNLGALYNSQKQSDKAIPILLQAQKILAKVNAEADLALIDFSLGTAYYNQKEFGTAKNLYLKSLRKLIPLEANEYIGSLYLGLIPIYANLKMPDSASYYTEKYKEFQNKEIGDKVTYQTAELETKYQTEKKEKLLLQQEAETKRKNILLLLVSVFAIFVALVGYLIYRQQKLKNRQQQQEHELKFAISKIEAQNELQQQRLSISRDLHDNIGAQLTFIISSVDNIKYGFNVENPNLVSKLDHISNFTKSTIVELRDTIWAMNSDAITFKDLELRVMNFIEKAKKAKENVNFVFEIDPELNKLELGSVVGMNVYRTIQEAVHNAVKYADANQIAIKIFTENNKIQIEITDDGNGFDLIHTDTGNGLPNMKKRIRDIGGICHIDSSIGIGTVIKITIPNSGTQAPQTQAL